MEGGADCVNKEKKTGGGVITFTTCYNLYGLYRVWNVDAWIVLIYVLIYFLPKARAIGSYLKGAHLLTRPIYF